MPHETFYMKVSIRELLRIARQNQTQDEAEGYVYHWKEGEMIPPAEFIKRLEDLMRQGYSSIG
jgi:hypothetical protein